MSLFGTQDLYKPQCFVQLIWFRPNGVDAKIENFHISSWRYFYVLTMSLFGTQDLDNPQCLKVFANLSTLNIEPDVTLFKMIRTKNVDKKHPAYFLDKVKKIIVLTKLNRTSNLRVLHIQYTSPTGNPTPFDLKCRNVETLYMKYPHQVCRNYKEFLPV